MEGVIRHPNERTEYLFISFDIGTLGPAFAPGAGTPEPGGLTPRQAFPTVRRLCADSDVVGFELVELNPLADLTYVSAMNASRIVHECLTGMAMRKMGLTDRDYLSPITTDHFNSGILQAMWCMVRKTRSSTSTWAALGLFKGPRCNG